MNGNDLTGGNGSLTNAVIAGGYHPTHPMAMDPALLLRLLAHPQSASVVTPQNQMWNARFYSTPQWDAAINLGLPSHAIIGERMGSMHWKTHKDIPIPVPLQPRSKTFMQRMLDMRVA